VTSDDDFRFHAGEVGNLFDELRIISSEDSGQPGLHGGRGAAGDECGVAFGQLQHFSDALAGSDFEIRNAAEMFSTEGHDFFDFSRGASRQERSWFPAR